MTGTCCGGRSVIGIKIYDYDQKFSDLFLEWRSLGINTAFVSLPLISKDGFKDLAKQNCIKLFAIIPVFYNPEILIKKPDLYAITGQGLRAHEEWVSFICPSRQDHRQEIIDYVKAVISDNDPDGISLDFIRHFVFWEKITHGSDLDPLTSSCFDLICLNDFQQVTNLSVPTSLTTVAQKAEWILVNCGQEWAEWKCQIITTMVRDIVEGAKNLKSDILINVHGVPWRKGDFNGAITKVVGQDYKGISNYTDFISPMCYSHMLRRKASWINSVVDELHLQSGSKIIPSIQVKEYYRDESLTAIEFENCLNEALRPPSQGVVFWDWDMLAQDPQKKVIVRNLV